MITQTIEIDRRPEDVFAYMNQLERHGEWQKSIVTTEVETDGPVGVGTRVRESRKIGGRKQDTSYEITGYEPPRRTSFRGIAGPIRPDGTVTLEPAGGGQRTRLTVEIELVGRGLGKLIAPFARMQANRQLPQDQQRLKARLEAGA